MKEFLTDLRDDQLEQIARSIGSQHLAINRETKFPVKGYLLQVENTIFRAFTPVMIASLVCQYEKNEPRNVFFIVDTGSTQTLISKNVKSALIGKDACSSDGYLIKINGYECKVEEAADFENTCVLGMDYLMNNKIKLRTNPEENYFLFTKS